MALLHELADSPTLRDQDRHRLQIGVPLGRSDCRQEASLQIGQRGASIGLPLDQFEAGDVFFNRTGAVREGQPGGNGRFVPFDTPGEGDKGGDGGGTHLA